MKIIKLCFFLLWSNVTLGQSFESKENSGLNKLDRINSIESHMITVDKTINELKVTLSKAPDIKGLTKLIEELTSNQKLLKTDIESLRTDEIAQLKKDIEFVDQEKVEKLVEKFIKYQEDTDKRVKLLEDSLKEINGQLKRVDSPIKN